MEIKDRIKKLGPYFKEMQITTVDSEQVVYVVVQFPHGWIISEDVEEKFGVTVGNGDMIDEYYFCASIDDGQDIIFDAIEYNINKMKDAIERAQLLSIKVKELKGLFEDESITLEQLRTLKFNFENNSDLVITKKRGRPSKQGDDTVEQEADKEETLKEEISNE